MHYKLSITISTCLNKNTVKFNKTNRCWEDSFTEDNPILKLETKCQEANSLQVKNAEKGEEKTEMTGACVSSKSQQNTSSDVTMMKLV